MKTFCLHNDAAVRAMVAALKEWGAVDDDIEVYEQTVTYKGDHVKTDSREFVESFCQWRDANV